MRMKCRVRDLLYDHKVEVWGWWRAFTEWRVWLVYVVEDFVGRCRRSGRVEWDVVSGGDNAKCAVDGHYFDYQ
jgi:hypothetical protein